MKSKYKIIPMSFLMTFFVGCTSHMHFAEESHFGLKASFASSSISPYELDLGYRRGMIAAIPLQSEGDGSNSEVSEDQAGGNGENEASVTDSEENSPSASNESNQKEIIITRDKNELMSLYSIFKANIGFDDPVEIYHFLATGRAAVDLLSNHDELRKIVNQVSSEDEEDLKE